MGELSRGGGLDVGRDPLAEASVSVVLPCHDEELNLPLVLDRLPDGLHEVIVVDSNCTDRTVEVARESRPDVVVVRAEGRGKGRALLAGFGAATGDVIVAMDADGSNDPREIAGLVGAVLCGADLAKGSRYLPGGGSDDNTRLRDLGNRILCSVFNRRHGASYTDLCYGYMAFRADHRGVLSPDCEGFEVEAELNRRACAAGLKVTELPSHEADRVHGESNLHPVRDGVRILRAILR